MMEGFMLVIGNALLVFSISYVALYILLKTTVWKDKEPPKDLLILMALGITIIVHTIPIMREFTKSMVAFVAGILIFIFLTALIFGLSGENVFEKLTKKTTFSLAILLTLIVAGVYFGATAYWNYQMGLLSNQTQQQTVNPFNRTISPVERVVFDPRVLSTIAFLMIFAFILYIVSKGESK